MSFESLKKNRGSKSLDKLKTQLEKVSDRKSYADPHEDKFWKPTRDAAGNAFAIIRFLPEPAGEDMPFIKMYDYGFQGPTGLWYIENSLQSIGKEDPAAKLYFKLRNDENKENAELAKKISRRIRYISNIYIVKDSGNPENEGKVFLYKYGPKIYDKLNDMMNPEFEDDDEVNPFDLWTGANFRLKMRKGDGGFPNYDRSEWDSPSPLFGDDDDKKKEVYDAEYSLQELLDPKYFKSYEDLEARLHRTLGLSEDDATPSSKRAEDLVDEDLDMSKLGGTQESKMEKAATASEPTATDDDDDLAFFNSLAKM